MTEKEKYILLETAIKEFAKDNNLEYIIEPYANSHNIIFRFINKENNKTRTYKITIYNNSAFGHELFNLYKTYGEVADFFNIYDQSELKPCPFCGGKAEIRTYIENDPPFHYDVISVKCIKCGASTVKKISNGYYDQYCSPEEISELWNRRV